MMSKTGYLGPEGSYSQLAAQNIRRGTPVAYPSFPALFGALVCKTPKAFSPSAR